MPPADHAPHVPERTCVACRTKRPQAEFVRVARVAGVWTVQAGQTRTGRGAYVCQRPECWQEKKLRRAFGGQAAGVAAQLATLTPIAAPKREHADSPQSAPPLS